jgi:hypothetical protein
MFQGKMIEGLILWKVAPMTRWSPFVTLLCLIGCSGSGSPSGNAAPIDMSDGRVATEADGTPRNPTPSGQQPRKAEVLPEHREAVDRFKTMGGQVMVDSQGEVYAVKLSGTRVTDKQLEPLARMKNLRLLNLDDTGITDAGLVHVKDLVGLKVLTLCRTRISDSGLVHLANLKELERLRLNDTDTSDAGLEHLKSLKSLKKFQVPRTRITPNGIANLKKEIPGLERAFY